MKCRFIGVVSASLLLSVASQAHASEYLYSYSAPDGSFQFVDSGTPAPYIYAPGQFTDLLVTGTFDGKDNDSFYVDFYSTSEIGGVQAHDIYYNGVDSDGPQIYAGPESAPIFVPGVYNITTRGDLGPGMGPGTFTITNLDAVSAAPEPSVWALMLAGFAMIGATLRFGRRQRGTVIA